MSLINQMLQDLEQRRANTATAAPLGGVGTGAGLLASSAPINYLLLGAVLVLAVVVAFLVGAQRTQTTQVLQVVPTPASQPVEEIVIGKSAVSIEAPVVSHVETTQPPSPSTEQAKTPVEVEQKPMPQQRTPAQPAPISHASQSRQEQQPAAETPATPKTEKERVTDEQLVAPADESPIAKTLRPLSVTQRAGQLFQRGVTQLGRGERRQAGATLQAALDIDPKHIRSRETLAALLLNEGRTAEAGAMLRDGLRLMPKATALAKLYARILAGQGDNAAAIAVLEQAQATTNDDAEYLALLAAFYQREQRHAQAARTYQRVLQQRPSVASWWMGLALSLESLGDTGQALNAYQRARQLGGLSHDVAAFVAERIRLLSTASAQHMTGGED